MTNQLPRVDFAFCENLDEPISRCANDPGLRRWIKVLPLAAYVTNREGRVSFHNVAAAALWGCDPCDETGSGIWRLTLPDDTPLPPLAGEPACRGLRRRPAKGEEAFVTRRDGGRIPVVVYRTPLHDRAGAPPGTLHLLVDVSERKRDEAKRSLVTKELSHRFKNILAIVQSIAVHTALNAPAPDAFQNAFSARLAALARAHDMLTSQPDCGAALIEIVLASLLPFRDGGATASRTFGPALRLAPNAAIAISLILYELATNASKYGALSCPGGTVRISWHVEDDAVLALLWRERGGPRVEQPPLLRGFGTRLHDSFAAQLQATVERDYAPPGLRFRIAVPLDRLSEHKIKNPHLIRGHMRLQSYPAARTRHAAETSGIVQLPAVCARLGRNAVSSPRAGRKAQAR